MHIDFEWDSEKSDATLASRGFGFAYAARIFEGPVWEIPSDRHGEQRVLAVGQVEGSYYTVIYTLREERYRIISARRARKNEERAYRAVFPG